MPPLFDDLDQAGIELTIACLLGFCALYKRIVIFYVAGKEYVVLRGTIVCLVIAAFANCLAAHA